MTNEKIFAITGKEILKGKFCSKIDDGKDEESEVSKINYKSGLHVFTILFGCGLAMSILTLIPRHNSIEEATYWCEIIFPAGLAIFLSITSMFVDLSILMERETMISIGLYLKVILAGLLTWMIPFCSCYILWTKIFDYNHPMPLVGSFCTILNRLVQIVSIPKFSSSSLFEKQGFQSKFNNFVRYQLLWYMVIMVKTFLKWIFIQLQDTDAQCVIAVLVPVAKKFTNLAFSKLIKQMVGTENEKANALLSVTMNISYGLFSAINLIGARFITMVGTVVGEFLIQLNMTYQVVKLHRKTTVLEDKQARIDKQKAVMKLLMAELCEGFIPLAYAIGFSMAFYGPNGYLFGTVRNVDDGSRTFTVMVGLFAIDLISLLLNSTIVWNCCKINLLDEFCTVMQNYWYIMALKMINNIYIYFFFSDLNLGGDMTMKFDWITRNESSSTFSDMKYV